MKKLNMQQRGYEIRKVEGRYIVHCARPVKLLNEDYYIENYRDITEVFANQAGYARTFSIIMGLLFLVSGRGYFSHFILAGPADSASVPGDAAAGCGQRYEAGEGQQS